LNGVPRGGKDAFTGARDTLLGRRKHWSLRRKPNSGRQIAWKPGRTAPRVPSQSLERPWPARTTERERAGIIDITLPRKAERSVRTPARMRRCGGNRSSTTTGAAPLIPEPNRPLAASDVQQITFCGAKASAAARQRTCSLLGRPLGTWELP
jgi:hypothetical protein